MWCRILLFVWVLGLDVFIVYETYGMWAITAAICFPVTMFMVPALAMMDDSENIIPMAATVVSVLVLIHWFAQYLRTRSLRDSIGNVASQLHTPDWSNPVAIERTTRGC